MTSPRRTGRALRRALTLGLATGLWLTVAIPTGAAGTPDAHYTTPTTSWLQINGTQMLAQTFTAQATGQLDQVDLPLGGMWNAGGKIYIVPAGAAVTSQPAAMTSSSFGSYSGQSSCCNVYGSYPIAPAYPVTANGHYAIVVVPNPGTSVMWGVVFGGAYPGGQVWKGYQPSTWFSLANMAFDFKTYVTASSVPPSRPASPPTVTRVKSDVPVTEGTVPTNSGTFADAAGHTVHLTASSGTLNYTPASSGNWTWTWTTNATDERPSQTITINADDGNGGTAQATFTTESNDATPTVSGLQVSNSMIVTTQQSLTFTGTYTDDGAAVDTSYMATWSFGDGNSSSAAAPGGLTATHAYGNAGTYTATLTVKDDDGMAGSASTTVTVLSPLQVIAKMGSYLQGLGDLSSGQKNSLQAKLNAAADSYQRGDTGAACNQLNAFINEVDADQKAGRLTTAEAGNLTDASRLTQRSMGCFKPLVEFLSGL